MVLNKNLKAEININGMKNKYHFGDISSPATARGRSA